MPTAQTLSLDFPDEPLLCGLHSKPHTVRPQNTLRSSGILPIHSRKLTQMTKIGNGLYVLFLFNENAHGCNTEQTIATRSVSDSLYTIPFVGEQEPKM